MDRFGRLFCKNESMGAGFSVTKYYEIQAPPPSDLAPKMATYLAPDYLTTPVPEVIVASPVVSQETGNIIVPVSEMSTQVLPSGPIYVPPVPAALVLPDLTKRDQVVSLSPPLPKVVAAKKASIVPYIIGGGLLLSIFS